MKTLRLLPLVLVMLLMVAGCAEKVASVQDNNDTTPPPDNEQPGIVLPGDDLIYFWIFDGRVPNNRELTRLDATFEAQNEAFFEFFSGLPGYPNTNRKGSMERRNMPTEINYKPAGNDNKPFETSDMRGIQFRQPFEGQAGDHTVIFSVPTTGFSAIQFSLAGMDEGAASALRFDYSVTSGEPNWITTGLPQTAIIQSLTTGDFKLFKVDFANISAVDNNPDFKIRMRFLVPDGDVDNGDRVTINNVALEGSVIE